MFCLPIPPNSRISTFRWKVMLLFSADAEFIFVHEMNAYYTLTQHSCNRKLGTGTYCHWNWMVNSSGTCQLYWWIDKIYWNVRASILSVLGRTFVIVVSMGICLWNIYFILHVAQTARCEFIWWLVSFDAVAGGEALTPSTVYSVTSTFAFITNTPYLQLINFLFRWDGSRTKVIDDIPSIHAILPNIHFSLIFITSDWNTRPRRRSVDSAPIFLFAFYVAYQIPFIFFPIQQKVFVARIPTNIESSEANEFSLFCDSNSAIWFLFSPFCSIGNIIVFK